MGRSSIFNWALLLSYCRHSNLVHSSLLSSACSMTRTKITITTGTLSLTAHPFSHEGRPGQLFSRCLETSNMINVWQSCTTAIERGQSLVAEHMPAEGSSFNTQHLQLKVSGSSWCPCLRTIDHTGLDGPEVWSGISAIRSCASLLRTERKNLCSSQMLQAYIILDHAL